MHRQFLATALEAIGNPGMKLMNRGDADLICGLCQFSGMLPSRMPGRIGLRSRGKHHRTGRIAGRRSALSRLLQMENDSVQDEFSSKERQDWAVLFDRQVKRDSPSSSV
jgi:hypothetical protein